MQDDLTQC